MHEYTHSYILVYSLMLLQFNAICISLNWWSFFFIFVYFTLSSFLCGLKINWFLKLIRLKNEKIFYMDTSKMNIRTYRTVKCSYCTTDIHRVVLYYTKKFVWSCCRSLKRVTCRMVRLSNIRLSLPSPSTNSKLFKWLLYHHLIVLSSPVCSI